MKEHSITQKYALGQEVKFNNKTYRINAFRYEARHIGNLKVYEISDGEGNRAETVEAVLDQTNEFMIIYCLTCKERTTHYRENYHFFCTICNTIY